MARRALLTILPLALALATGWLQAGLLASYPFDGNFADASGNGNHLTVATGTPAITTAAGEFAVGGGALDVNSTISDQHYLSLANAITFGAGDAWSVAFWVRRRPGSDNRQGMVIGTPGNTRDFIWIPDNPSQVQGLRFRSSSNTNANYGGFPDDGQWHHWVVIANGSGQVSAYRDNVPLGSISTTSSFSITSVGQAYSSSTQSMNGQVDELYIYDEAIDATKVAELFAGSSGPDTTPPTLAGSAIVDNQGGGPVIEDTLVTYTVSFSEDMDGGTVSASDFGNAGSAPVSIGTVSETSPGVFSVPVTPTDPGSLQLEVMAGAVLTDTAGNPLATASAIVDDTTITVEASGGSDTTPPTLSPGDMVDDQGGGPVVEGTVVTFTVSFSEDMDASSVDASDFGNAGTAPVGIGTVSETSPGVFSVPVTPTAPGTLQLEIVVGAVLTDVAGNPLNTTSAIADDTTITVEAAPNPSQVDRLRVFLLGGQSNADGRANPSGLPTSPVNLQQPQDDVDFYEGSTLTTLRPFSQFGPEITLGRRLADSIGDGTTRVAIIKYATGGTSLAVDWAPGGDGTTTGDGPQYVSFQGVMSNGLAALAAAYPNAVITIEGMLWVQGERDAKGGFENQYEANLTAFIADVRATYGADLLFIVSRLSSGQTNIPAGPLAIVRAAQTAVAAADPRAALVDTDGFGLLGDNLHFDAVGQQQIGNASAGALLAFFPFTTDPTFELLGNGDIEVTVNDAFPGFLYTLQTNLTLQPGAWADVESVTATGPPVVFTYTPSAGETHRFFRVGRSAAP